MIVSRDAGSLLTPTIFHEPWWLEKVSGGRYREVRVFSGNRVVGRLPFVQSRRFGMTLVQMPMLTHFLGPAIEEGNGNGPTRFLHQLSITKALIRQLPSASHVYIKHHRTTTNVVAFQALGFLTDVQFTSEIVPASEDALWRRMRDKTRNVIRRAEERFDLEEVREPRRFTELYNAHLSERKLANYYDSAVAETLIAECLRRGAGRVLAARDRDGTAKAAIFCVWDEACEYYLMSTRTRGAGNGAVSLLLWNAIKHASAANLLFDFDGIKGASDAQFYSGFGGTTKGRLISYLNTQPYRIYDRLTRNR